VSIAPWTLDAIAAIWDEHGAKALGFRVFTLGKAGSKPRACKRLAVILQQNRQILGGGDTDRLADSLQANLLVALIYLQDHGLERAKQVTGTEYSARLTFWRFIDPPDNLIALSNQALGRDPAADDQDKARRDTKAKLLRDFQGEVTAWVERAAYRSGDDNSKLTAALAAARRALAIAEDELSC
jgi:hypothetical protein